MAVLPDADRAAVWADLMREISNERESCPLLKTQLREVIDAIDTWRNANAASLNSAIPQPQRGLMSAALKARIFTAITRKAYIVGA